MSGHSKAAENMIGNFAPKLVELTDRVLFDTSGNGRIYQSAIAAS